MVANVFNGPNSMMQCPYRDFVLVIFFHSDAVIGIPGVLLSITKISGRGYRFFTVGLLSTCLSTNSCSPPSSFSIEIRAAAGSVHLSPLLVSLALSEIF